MIISTFPNLKEAKKVINQLLEEHHIACANIIPEIISFYRWNNQIQEQNEIIVFLKTRRELEIKVNDKIKSIHSYDVPDIYAVESTYNISKSYLEWIIKETQEANLLKK